MTPREMNRELLVHLPELRELFAEETEWQEGDDTGAHVTYGDVFLPVLEAAIRHRDETTSGRYLGFVERLCVLDDEYAQDVVTGTVLEGLYLSGLDRDLVRGLLGDASRAVWDSFAST